MLYIEMKLSAIVLGPGSHARSDSNGDGTFVVFRNLRASSDKDMAREIHLGRNLLDNVAQLKHFTNNSAECNVLTLS